MDGRNHRAISIFILSAAYALLPATARGEASGIVCVQEAEPERVAGARTGPGGETLLVVRDAAGFPLPFVDYLLSSTDGSVAFAGRTGADGSFLVRAEKYPFSIGLSARGAVSKADFDGETLRRGGLVLSGARPLPRPLDLDVVFVIDATASMKPYAAPLRRAIRAFFDSFAGDESINPSYGFVFLGEDGDRPVLDAHPLSPRREELLSTLEAYAPLGGGDEEEPIGRGILEASEASMGWRDSSARIVFVLSDAGLKPLPASMGDVDAEARAASAGITIIGVGLGRIPPSGEGYLRAVSARTLGAYISGGLGKTPYPSGERAVAGSLEDIMAGIVRAELDAALVSSVEGSKSPALALLDEAQRRMAAGLAYPERARLRGVSGVTGLRLQVGPDGALEGARVASGSGSAILDRAALSLAKESFPIANPSGIAVELFISVKYRLDP